VDRPEESERFTRVSVRALKRPIWVGICGGASAGVVTRTRRRVRDVTLLKLVAPEERHIADAFVGPGSG
jgi:hypothetical protein